MYQFPHPMASPTHWRAHESRATLARVGDPAASFRPVWQCIFHHHGVGNGPRKPKEASDAHTLRLALVGEGIQTIVEDHPLYPVIEALWLNQYEEDHHGGEHNQGKSWSDLPGPAREC